MHLEVMDLILVAVVVLVDVLLLIFYKTGMQPMQICRVYDGAAQLILVVVRVVTKKKINLSLPKAKAMTTQFIIIKSLQVDLMKFLSPTMTLVEVVKMEHLNKLNVLVVFQEHSVSLAQLELSNTILVMVCVNLVQTNLSTHTTTLLLKILLSARISVLMVLRK